MLGKIEFGKSLTIDASMLPNKITIDGGNLTPRYDEPDGIRLFEITDLTGGADPPLVTFDNLTFTGGDPVDINGGAIKSQGRLVIRNSTFRQNTAQGYGGAIYVGVLPNDGTPREVLRIIDSLIEDNHGATGGGIAVASAPTDTAYVFNTTIKLNLAHIGNGGGIHLAPDTEVVGVGSMTIVDSEISENENVAEHGGHGGGIYAQLAGGAFLHVERSKIFGNQSKSGSGGGVWAASAPVQVNPFPATRAVTILSSSIIGNQASNEGGGLYISNADGTETLVEYTRFTNNGAHNSDNEVSYGKGGGIYVHLADHTGVNKPRFTINRSTVDNNNAHGAGGGIYVRGYSHGEFYATNVTVSDNETGASNSAGGGIYVAQEEGGSLSVQLRHATITQNTSPTGGGIAVANLSGVVVRMENSIVSENYATQAKTTAKNLAGRFDIANTKYNLYGSGSTILDHVTGNSTSLHSSNIPSDAPLLEALADNGGPTWTHRPKTGSAVVDAGDPAIVFSATEFDQRGPGFARVFDIASITRTNPTRGPVDIGAYEVGAPKVLDVIIRSSVATTHPSFHFNTVDGSGLQLRTVPVAKIDTVAVRFSEDVTNISQSSLTMQQIPTAATSFPLRTLNPYEYAASTHIAEWRFMFPFHGNQYRLLLPDTITNVYGDALDGEWTNPFSVTTVNSAVSEFPSGNGSAGGVFNFAMTFLPGDANLNNAVDGMDYLIWQAYFGGSGVFTNADFTGDGTIDALDDDWWAMYFGQTLYSLKLADFDHNGYVDGADFLTWQNNYGSTSATHADGDADHDGDVDDDDYNIWDNQFGWLFSNEI